MKKKKKIKIRRSWGNVNPVTKVKQSKKIYKRRKRLTPLEIQEFYGVE